MSAEQAAAGAVLSIDTLVYYGLKQQPFAAEAPDAFIYSDAALDMAVNATANYLDQNEHGIVIKGEPGIGKSTQIRRLLSRLRGRFNPCVLPATVTTTLAEAEHRMAECWQQGQPVSQTDAGWLCDLLTRGLRPVLVVDDAHLLSADVLEGLFRLQRDIRERCGRSFGLVLFGESSIETTLSAIEADVPEAGQCHAILLRPLTREQIAAYVDHRLRTAGLFMDNPFTEQDIAQLHEDTQGIPAAINPAATRILEAHGQAEIRREQAGRQGWLRQHRMALVLATLTLLLTAGLWWLLQGYVATEPPGEAPAEDTPPTARHQPLELPPPLEENDTTPTAEPAPKAVPEPTTASLPSTPRSETPPASVPEPKPASVAAATLPPAPAGKTRAERPAPSTGSDSVPTPGATTTRNGAQPAPPTGTEQPPAPSEAARAPKADPRAKAGPASPASPETARGSSAPARKTVAVRQIAGLQPPAWLLKQDPKQFAIQLAALSEPAGLARIAHELKLNKPLAWYHLRRGGKSLYVLVTAPYPDRSAARRAIGRLPASLRRSGPWIRPLKDIQDLIYAQ